MKKNIDITNELTEISPIVAEIKPMPTIAAPLGYFNELPNSIVSKLKSLDENSDTLIILENTGKTNPLTVPTGYFDKLNDNILSKIKRGNSSARTIAMPLLKWAAAACVIGLIGFSVYNKFFFTRKQNEIDKEWQDSYTLSKIIIKENDFDIFLQQLDDKSIVDFLQENGHDVNAALLASITETENINDVNEYFCDDENLNLMMNNLDIIEKQ
jgi:hypothetical protein